MPVPMNPAVRAIMDHNPDLTYQAAYARWAKQQPGSTFCVGCETELREPSADGLCGFCRAERAA